MPPAHSAKHDRRALAALLAVFALMVQALIPAAAMAAAPGPAGALVICTAFGAQTVTPDGKPAAPAPRKGFAGMPCRDCLAAAMSAVAPAPAPAVQPVVYQAARLEHAPPVRLDPPNARAPPRPLGQGPPASLQSA